jgi:hypothetical protein
MNLKCIFRPLPNGELADCFDTCPYYDTKSSVMQGPDYHSFCIKVRNECIEARKTHATSIVVENQRTEANTTKETN